MAIFHSLRQAFTVSYLLVASIPVLLFGLMSIQLVSEQQLKGVQERNMRQTLSIAEEVDAFLVEVRSDLQHVRNVLDADSILHPGSIDEFLGSVVANSQFFESIYYLDKGYQVLNLGIIPEFEFRRDDYRDLDYSGHEVFHSSIEKDGTAWSNTFVSLLTGELTVTLGLHTEEGFLLGNIRLSSLERLLQRYAPNGELEVAIIDNSGTLIAHSVSEKAMQRINFSNHPVVSRAMAGENTTSEYRHETVYLLESAADIDTAQWVVWAGLDMHVVYEPINYLRNILIGFMVVTAVVASIISLYNMKRLMLPLTSLGRRANQIADGHYMLELDHTGFSEIDSLADQINSMSHAIKVREESIITNEKRFRDLVNSIDGVVWEMDFPSFLFLFVSQQAESILGYPIQEWYEDSRFWENKMHDDDMPQAKAYCQLMTEKKQDHDFEFRMIAADGRIVWIRNLATVVVENGRPVRLLGVMIDITEQKLLLEELASSEENYREIFNASSDAIFIHDADTGKILDVNQAMLTMYNCTYEEAVNSDLESFSYGESPYSIEDAMAKINKAKSEGQCTFEWYSRKMSGELFWTEVYLRSATIGGESRIIAAERDISARKHAEEQLKELNARLVLLIDRMPLGCIYWSPEFKVSLWNPAAEKIFGFKESEILGNAPFGLIVPEDTRPVVEQVWQRLLDGDESAHSVNDNMTRDGHIITCEWFNTPVRNQENKTVGVISMVQDISERKMAEDELARYRMNLEELVRERSAQLEEAQSALVQKERLAVLGQLTATVSHEIRNPLGTVANALYLLKESLEGSGHEHLQRPLLLAERNVERCDSIISELLDFSRQRQIEKKPVDIDAWLREFFSEITIPADVRLQTDLSVNRKVHADVERLRRVMINITTNAFQAFKEIEKADKILTVQTTGTEDKCHIVFEDNGPGMSEDVLARIFEPMFSTKNFGVGLGVPIIKSIVENHGGEVKYSSTPGVGTTVTIKIPIEDNQQGESP